MKNPRVRKGITVPKRPKVVRRGYTFIDECTPMTPELLAKLRDRDRSKGPRVYVASSDGNAMVNGAYL